MSSTGRGSKREEADLYPTPKYTVSSIVSRLDAEKVSKCSFLEPCRGFGAISDQINAKSKQFAELSEGIDYLRTPFKSVDLIVTNPPFSLAIEFLRKSLSESDCVVYLLRLNFLGSKKRKRFWKNNVPSHIYILTKRPSFTGKGTDSTEYAWFAWDRSGLLKDPPGVYWL